MDKETREFVYKATLENVCNVDGFPEIQLVKPSEAMAVAIEVEIRLDCHGESSSPGG